MQIYENLDEPRLVLDIMTPEALTFVFVKEVEEPTPSKSRADAAPLSETAVMVKIPPRSSVIV